MATANPFTAFYELQSRGTTPEGLPCAVVARECEGRKTTYFLVQRETNRGPKWFSTGPQQVSNGTVRFFPEKKSVRLTDSRLDRTLNEIASAA